MFVFSSSLIVVSSLFLGVAISPFSTIIGINIKHNIEEKYNATFLIIPASKLYLFIAITS
ncbi:hypothetical protein D3C76_723020 [compost metagenome]